MKRNVKPVVIGIILISIVIGVFISLNYKKSSETSAAAQLNNKVLNLESRKCFDFFWKEANGDKNSKGYGLIRDRAPGNPNIASIASVGYGLSALTVGAERKWVDYDAAKERAIGTLNTLLNNVPNEKGFFYHFLNMDTAQREWDSEASIIDTSIALCGAIDAGEYFGGEVKEKAEELYKRVDWNWYRNPSTNQFYMGYTPEKGFFGAWDMAAEQFMMYFLAAGSPTHPVDGNMFYGFNRTQTSYGYYPAFIQSPAGSIFTYQYSFAWFDFRNKVDKDGVNWWTNSVLASKASKQYCIDNKKTFKTFGENSWGLTACDGPAGYNGGYGINSNGNDGTIAPSGAAGSIVFTPKDSIAALENYYNNYKGLWGEYGFADGYNLDVSPAWYDKDVIGIDKGITLLMIENYQDNLIWKYFMKNKYVIDGMKKSGLNNIITNGKPTVHSLVIDGTPPIVGKILNVSYYYYNDTGDKEGNSIYRWLVGDSPDGTFKEIPGEKSLTYKIRKADSGKYIKFEVTPVSSSSKKGEPVMSYPIGEVGNSDPRMVKSK